MRTLLLHSVDSNLVGFAKVHPISHIGQLLYAIVDGGHSNIWRLISAISSFFPYNPREAAAVINQWLKSSAAVFQKENIFEFCPEDPEE